MSMEWIKCSERLPPDTQVVLGYRSIMGTFSIVFCNSTDRRFMFAYEAEYASDITHWAKISEPKESTDDQTKAKE